MNPFLYNIAEKYYQHHGTKISDYTFVFPNRRSGLFFQKYLGEIIEKPLFSPKILTINELFMSQSSYLLADKMGMLFRIYNIFKQLSKTDETFDVFAYWGEMLINDFDDIDKYLVDAKQLFTNIKELKEIDNLFDYLSPEQLAAIRTFWTNFMPTSEGKKQQEFISTWEILYPIYEQFKHELSEKGLAYEGMIFREVVDKLKESKDAFANFNKIIFVGFNALTPCEKILFKYLKNKHKADFYWDYFSEKVTDDKNLASLFYLENKTAFPSDYEIKEEKIIEKKITMTGIPSTVGQTKEIYQILESLHLDKEMAFKTAIVLPDEKMLVPLLHSLPDEIENVNVTMGYPLSSTPLAGLVDYIFELQKNIRHTDGKNYFYHKDVLAILNHQYIYRLHEQEIKALIKNITLQNRFYISEQDLGVTDLLKTIFQVQQTPIKITAYLIQFLQELQASIPYEEKNKKQIHLEKEFLYHYLITIKRTNDLLKDWTIEMNLETFFRLLRKLIINISIPFTGEPLSGLQVMGVLETRAIDFENLIITSMNEGVFPKRQISASFVPYNLRKGFGMPTTEHQDSIFAYHFYRLIHRAKNIYFLYDTRTDGMQTGEVSRYIHQLRYHYKVPIVEKLITYDISVEERKNITVDKSPEVMGKLSKFLTDNKAEKRAFSATAINTYLDCPLKFYFSTIERLSETEDVKETIEANDFGTIFHAVMQNIYESDEHKLFTPEKIEAIIKNDIYLDKMIRKAFGDKYLHIPEEKVKLEGQYFLTASIIKKYTKKLLQQDKQYAPFIYLNAEFHCESAFPIANGEKPVNLHGYIDRIDEKDGAIRIVDYKTGNGKSGYKDKKTFSDMSKLFEKEKDDRPKEILQLFMYSMVYQQQTKATKIFPAVVFLRNLFDDTESNHIKFKPNSKETIIVENFDDFKPAFESHFRTCLEEIFDESIPFQQATTNKPCQYCPFTEICKK
jgi:hypothetical protein